MNVIDLTESESSPIDGAAARMMMPPVVFPAEPIGVNVSVDVLDLTEGREDDQQQVASIAQNFDLNDIAEQRAASAAFSMATMASPAPTSNTTERAFRNNVSKRKSKKQNDTSTKKTGKREPPQQSPGESTNSKRKKKPRRRDIERAARYRQLMGHQGDEARQNYRMESHSHRADMQPPPPPRDGRREFGLPSQQGNAHHLWPPSPLNIQRHDNDGHQRTNVRLPPQPSMNQRDNRMHHAEREPPNSERHHQNGPQNRNGNHMYQGRRPPPNRHGRDNGSRRTKRNKRRRDEQSSQRDRDADAVTQGRRPRQDNIPQDANEERRGTQQDTRNMNGDAGVRSQDDIHRKKRRIRRSTRKRNKKARREGVAGHASQGNRDTGAVTQARRLGLDDISEANSELQRGTQSTNMNGGAVGRSQDDIHRKKRRIRRSTRKRNKKARQEEAVTSHQADKKSHSLSSKAGQSETDNLHTCKAAAANVTSLKSPPVSKNADEKESPQKESAASLDDGSQVKKDRVTEGIKSSDSGAKVEVVVLSVADASFEPFKPTTEDKNGTALQSREIADHPEIEQSNDGRSKPVKSEKNIEAAVHVSTEEEAKVDHANTTLPPCNDQGATNEDKDANIHVSLPELRTYSDNTGDTAAIVNDAESKDDGKTLPKRESCFSDDGSLAQPSTSAGVAIVKENVSSVAKEGEEMVIDDASAEGESRDGDESRPNSETNPGCVGGSSSTQPSTSADVVNIDGGRVEPSKHRSESPVNDAPGVDGSNDDEKKRTASQASSADNGGSSAQTSVSAEVIKVDDDVSDVANERKEVPSAKRFVQPSSASQTDHHSRHVSIEPSQRRRVQAASRETDSSSGDAPSLKNLIGSNSGSRSKVANAKSQNPSDKRTETKPPRVERKSWQSTVIIVESSDDESESHDASEARDKRKDPEVEFVKTAAAPYWPPKSRKKPGCPPSSHKRFKKKALGIERTLRNVGQYNFNYSEEEALREQERLLQEAANRVRREAAAATSGSQVASDVNDLRHDHWKSEDPYLRLGLNRNAPIRDVKRRYRRLALVYHPDKGSTYVHTASRFQAVTEAYKLLCEESERLY